jgi:transposase InsO family protein
MARQEVPMSVRRAIVEAMPAEMNVSEFCRQHGVSTWFFWDLRRRHARDGDEILTPRSRAPHHPAGRTSVEMEDRIAATRKELDDAGLDAGAGSIAFHLRDVPGVPSESTIWRILVARGQIVRQPAKAPKTRGGFTAQRANECWALDDTSWALANGTDVKILNVLDDHSRLCVASTALATCTGAKTFTAMARAANDYGWPARIWSRSGPILPSSSAHVRSPVSVLFVSMRQTFWFHGSAPRDSEMCTP